MNIFVFDIETIPDVTAGRQLYELKTDGLSDADVAQIMVQQRLQDTAGKNEFLRHPLHQIVAISGVLNSGNTFKVGSLCEPEATEAEIIQRFFEIIERTAPTLVSWNGGGFDLPVLHYRALLHGVVAASYWELHGEYRFNNYLNRFHERHTDLMDVLAGYQPHAFAGLDDVAKLLGLPGKLGMSGDQVWAAYQRGQLSEIRHYCETDALNTYLIYLRFELMRGHLTHADYLQACQHLRELLISEDKPHFRAFVEAWTMPV